MAVLPAAEREPSAAPLAGVCRVEDGGERQLPGNARVADRWSAKDVGSPWTAGGCGLPHWYEAVAFCRVNRA